MLSYVTNIALVDTPPPFFALFDKVYQYMPWQGYEIIQRDAVHLVTKLYLILAVRIFLWNFLNYVHCADWGSSGQRLLSVKLSNSGKIILPLI